MQPKLRSLVVAFCAVLFSFVTINSFAQYKQNVGPATVTTDKPDYAPRSNAVFTGTGFAPGETVSLRVKNLFRACNTVTSDSSYQPWTVTADGSGNFITNWTVCDCNGDSLRLRAVGQTSHDTAYAYFSDAAEVTKEITITWISPDPGINGFCPGSKFLVRFRTDSVAPYDQTYGAGNTFKVVLSSPGGGWGGGSTNVLGTYIGTGTDIQGVIEATVPYLTGVGSQYSIRIVATNPNNVVGPSFEVPIFINPAPDAYNVTGGGIYCNTSGPVAIGLQKSQAPYLDKTVTNTISYQLYLNGTTPVGTPVIGTGSAISFTPQTAIGTYTVVATNTVTGCTNQMNNSVSITSALVPATLSKSPNVSSVCEDANVSASVTANGTGGTTGVDHLEYRFDGTGGWTNYTSGQSLSTTGKTLVEIRSYRTSSDATCNRSGDNIVSWTVTAKPTAANAGSDQLTVSGTSTTLDANTPLIGTGQWTIITGTGGSFGNSGALTSSNPAETFTGTVGVTYTLRWTITNGTCSSQDDVDILFNQIPTTISTTSPTVTYGATSVTLSATVSPNTGGGSVDFYIDGTKVGTGIVGAGGVAIYNYDPSSLNASTYTIKANFLGSGYYTTSTTDPADNGTLTITKRPITVTVDAGLTKVYGQSDPALTYTYTPNPATSGAGLSGTDAFDGSLSRVTGESVAQYTVNIGTLTIKNGSTDVSANYDITFVNTNKFSITKRPITVTANDFQKMYGCLPYSGGAGITLSGVNGVTVSGLAPGDTQSDLGTVAYSGTSQGAVDVGTYTIVPGGLTNGNYSYTYVNGTLTINPQPVVPIDATAFYTGSCFFWTTSPTSSTATLTLSATIKSTDCGDIKTARVTFGIRSGGTFTPIPGAQNLPVGLVDMNNLSLGTASAIVQYNIGSATVDIKDIAVRVTGNYRADDPSTDKAITIAVPLPGGQICGGGNLSNDAVGTAPNVAPASSGQILGAPGKTSNVAFYVKYNSSLKNPQGGVEVNVWSNNDRTGKADGILHHYKLRSNAISVLSVGKPVNTAQFGSKANLVECRRVNGVDVEESIEGNCTMQMDLYDVCGTGLGDKISIIVYRNKGGVWFTGSWNGQQSVLKDIVQDGSQVSVSGCQSASPITTNTRVSTENTTVFLEDVNLKLEAYPNPTQSQFNIKLRSSNTTDAINIVVYSINGKVVEQRQHLTAGQTIQLGALYRPGVYIIEMIQGTQRKQLKLVKIPD